MWGFGLGLLKGDDVLPQLETSKQAQSFTFAQYVSKCKGAKRTTPLVIPAPIDIILSFLGSFIGLSLLGVLTFHYQVPLLAASFGATLVLIFVVPDGPLSQPRNVIFGHIFSAIVGIITYYFFGLSWWSLALGTSLAITVMVLTKTTYPPGGATALFAILYKMGPIYILTPILVGAITLVFLAIIINNLSPNKSYPRYWY